MFLRKFLQISFLLIAFSCANLFAAMPARAFIVAQRWSIGGEGGWDHLAADPENHRLYVSRNDRVVVIDTQTGATLGEIPGAQNIHYICLDQTGRKAWVTDGAAGLVRVFDRSTLQWTAAIPLGFHPNAATFDPTSQSLFVFGERGSKVAVIDALSDAVTGTLALPGDPASAVTDGHANLLVALKGLNEIARVQMSSRDVDATWPIPGCVGPAGLAIDPAMNQLYSTCENGKLVTLDARSGKLLSAAEIGQGARELAIDTRRKLIFAADGGGILNVMRQTPSGKLSVLQKVKTQAGARTLAFDPGTRSVYLPTAQFGLRTAETSEELRFRPTPVPGSFVVLVVAN